MEEEYEERLARYGDAEIAADPEEHRFDIPKGHFWKDVRKHTTDIGTHLNRAFHSIEDANMRLKGVFQDVDFNNKERFPDAMLEKLLQHFEAYRLRKADVEPDMLGQAYEYLIERFADDSGKKGGEFYTPKMVVRLIVECLKPEEGMSVYDPPAALVACCWKRSIIWSGKARTRGAFPCLGRSATSTPGPSAR